METNKIYCGDALKVLQDMPDNSVHLVITSPPYGTLRRYSDDPEDLGNYSFEKQLPKLIEICKEIYRVLKPGRRFNLNYAEMHKKTNGEIRLEGVSWRLPPVMEEIGFIMKDIIVWEKAYGLNKYQGFGPLPYPGNINFGCSYEFIYVFKKPGKPDYSHVTPEIKKASAFAIKDDFMKWANAVWHFDKKSEESRFHKAPFHSEVVRRLIQIYSFVDEIVLDPFVGAGSCAIMAKRMGRRYIGIDLNSEYCKIAEERLVDIEAQQDFFNKWHKQGKLL